MESPAAEVIQGFVTGLYLSIYDFFDRRGARKHRIKILHKKLSDGRYEWRSTTQLARSIGQERNPEATTELLLEIAEHSAGEKDMWRLKK